MRKYLPYIVIVFIILVGLFSSAGKAQADEYSDCIANVNADSTGSSSPSDCAGLPGDPNPPSTTTSTASKPKTDFEAYIKDHGCGLGLSDNSSLFPGCLIEGSYWLFYVIPSLILWMSAYFFNVLISITLSSKLFAGSTFIPTAWGVVRDLSNIFFILILLYIAIKLILDLGGSEVKKMIVRVIIIALLINFSMFFTEVVIDSSNILALIFYNKTSVDTKTADGTSRPYDSATGEKDVAGGMVNAFDPTRLLTADFFKTAGTVNTGVTGAAPIQGEVSFGMLIGITIIVGLLMLFAAYCLFVAGISFVGRMIELFVLIIFSPFALMSSTIPLLGGIEYIGWDAWFKRLLKVSFMAPIFMFFIYFIFLLIGSKMFDSLIVQTNQSTIERILSIVIPALVILILLMKATSFAKKGSGVLGEKLMAGAKMLGGVALGAATGGAAMLATGTLGNLASRAASSKFLNENQNKKGLGGMAARMALKSADYGTKASFDVRKIAGVGALAKMGGIDLESAKAIGLGSKEGGYQQRRKENVEKRQKRAKELEMREDEEPKQKLNNLEGGLQKLLNDNEDLIRELDKDIESARQDLADTADPTEKISKAAVLQAKKDKKKNFRDTTTTNINGTDVSIADLEKDLIPKQKTAIQTENRNRKFAYAERLQNRNSKTIAIAKAATMGWAGNKLGIGATLGLGALGHPIIGGAMAAGILATPFAKEDKRANREAAHKIIMEVKLDSGTKTT